MSRGRIAANIAKLPELEKNGDRLTYQRLLKPGLA
jgi:hypothetical protein